MMVGMVTLLITPLILSFRGVATLGTVMSVSGLGMLAGGILMSAWGGPRRRINGVLGFHVLTAAALLLAAVPPTVPLVCLGAALFLFTIPPIGACFQAIWQSKVAPDAPGGG